MDYLDGALVAQRALTAVSSGYNALHFLGYRTPGRGRRLAALILALVNAAFLGGSLHPALTEWLRQDLSIGSPGLLAGALPLLASLAISVAILRGRFRHS